MYVYMPHMCLVSKEARKGWWIPPELELQLVVSDHVGAGNQNLAP